MELSHEPVAVPKAAVFFCRWGVAVILWCSYFAHSPALLALAFVILGLSALLKLKRAPLIVLYSCSLERLWPSPEVIMDARAMQFAHTLGAMLALVCLLAVTIFPGAAAWSLVLVFCLLKTVAAIGFCPASKMYECMLGGSCCAFLKPAGGAGSKEKSKDTSCK
jgi:hypothetical protein